MKSRQLVLSSASAWPRIPGRSAWVGGVLALMMSGCLVTSAGAQSPVLKGGVQQTDSGTLDGSLNFDLDNLNNDQKQLDAMSTDERAKHQSCEAMIQEGKKLVTERNNVIQQYDSLKPPIDEAEQTKLKDQITALAKQTSALEAQIERCISEPVPSPAPAATPSSSPPPSPEPVTMPSQASGPAPEPAPFHPSGGGEAGPSPTGATPSTPYVPVAPSVPSPSKEPTLKPLPTPGPAPEPAPKPPLKTGISKDQPNPTGAPPKAVNDIFYVNVRVRLQVPNNPTVPAWRYNDSSVELQTPIPKGWSGILESGRLAQQGSQDTLSVVKYATGEITPNPKLPGNYLFDFLSVVDLSGNTLKVEYFQLPGQSGWTKGTVVPMTRTKYSL